MILRDEVRRSLKMAATCHVGSRDKAHYHLKKNLTILFGKVNLISFFFAVLVIKANVVSHKVVKSTRMDKNAQSSIFENGTILFGSFVQQTSTSVVEAPMIHSNPITSSKLSILGNDSFLKVDGNLPAKNMQLSSYTATPNNVELRNLHYLSEHQTSPQTRPKIHSDIFSNRKSYVVIQNIDDLKCNEIVSKLFYQ